MKDTQQQLLQMISGLGTPIEILSIDFSAHVPKMLRDFADRIENNQMAVEKAVFIVDKCEPHLQKIELIMSKTS